MFPKTRQILDMLPLGEAGDHAAERAMYLDLRGDEVMQNAEARGFDATRAFHEGNRGLVTGSFDSEDIHGM